MSEQDLAVKMGLELIKSGVLTIEQVLILQSQTAGKYEQCLSQLHAANAEIERLRGALREIIQNAPMNEPTVVTPQTLPIAYSYWVARAIAIKAMQGD